MYMDENIVNRNMGSLNGYPVRYKLMLILSNVPLLLVIKKNACLGLLIFMVSLMFHWHQCFTDDEKKINEMCFYDVVINTLIGFYVFLSKSDQAMYLLPLIPLFYFLCAPYRFGMSHVYPYTHTMWHILAALLLLTLL